MIGGGAMRLFVAAEVPEAFRKACADARRLMGASLSSARWTRPEGVHLTFKFLGDTVAARVPAVREGVAAAASGIAPFSLRTGAAGLFGPPSRPRVLWIGLDGERGAAERLASRIEDAMGGLGYPREARPFRPHLTLARFREGGGSTIADADLESLTRAFEGIAFEVEELILFRSHLERGGAHYVPLSSARLSG